MNNELKFLIDTVKEASMLIIPEFEVKSKGNGGDLVTNFDYEIEKFIIAKMKENYPTFDIVSEEFNTNGTLSNNCFVIDPIDGTINFANGLPLWGIQVACVKDSETHAAVIYLPKLNSLYYADETGAYCNDTPIKVNNLPPEKSLYVVDGLDKMAAMVRMKRFSQHARDIWSEAVIHSWVADGKLGGVAFKGNSYWDYVPGQFIVKQAGGYIYNAPNIHIAANSQEFLNILLERAGNYENDIALTTND